MKTHNRPGHTNPFENERLQKSYNAKLEPIVQDKEIRNGYAEWLLDVHEDMVSLAMETSVINQRMRECIGSIKAAYEAPLSEPERRRLIETTLLRVGREARTAATVEQSQSLKPDDDIPGVIRDTRIAAQRSVRGFAHRVGRTGKTPAKVVGKF